MLPDRKPGPPEEAQTGFPNPLQNRLHPPVFSTLVPNGVPSTYIFSGSEKPSCETLWRYDKFSRSVRQRKILSPRVPTRRRGVPVARSREASGRRKRL